MDYQSLHMKTVVELRKLAKDQGVRVPAGTNKDTLIQMLLESEQGGKPAAKPEPAKAEAAGKPEAEKSGAEAPKPAARRGRPPKNAAGNARPAGKKGKNTDEKDLRFRSCAFGRRRGVWPGKRRHRPQ